MTLQLPATTSHPVPAQPWNEVAVRLRPSRARTALAGGLAALVVGVLVSAAGGAAMLLTDVLRSSAAAVAAPAEGQRPVVLPDEIGALRQQALLLADTGERTAGLQARLEDATARTVATLTGTYRAGAGAAAHSDADLTTIAWAMVVRTDVPAPAVLPAGPTAEDLHLAAPPREVITIGAVQCLVQTDTVPAGQQVSPADRHVQHCQRGDDDRTVLTSFGGSQPTLESAATWTDQVWAATAGV
ncbi:hypothetical protein [Nakamurella leprariae]|uniref:Uncharacterized protein n=1 Tax=Nakamurella leprariae TaxID=2803911 RepID=A0A938YDW6_9ACTN|nr:hypothetical protein [Nakamurella leprariae]MBM9466379.1 hypothetical protein [Nakamurella leprariae]